MPARLPAAVLAFSLLVFASAQAQTEAAASARKPSTPEERQRVVAITHKLEATPLDQTLYPEREWAKQWIVENPDVRIRMCMQLLAGLRTPPRYQFRVEMGNQMMLSSAAFLIEHPDKVGDHLAESVGGMQGVLKAYSSIVKANPVAHAPFLDDLLKKQNEGKLVDHVRETIKVCHF